ncbi:hypothetical protein [Shewanella spartinae]|uniref:hypothetical protein n=1 Tax=Shewanella spartinae TaxID=2864205 RepID=UPI001C65D2C5|nr:hypothetical protein [Shewanella spartinae]QYJ93627.1 hypothetical protein K0I31_18945 [Shewanella spartinae]
MSLVDFIKRYLSSSYNRKVKSWNKKGAMFFVKFDFVITLTQMFLPLALITAVYILGDWRWVVFTAPFFGGVMEYFLSLKYQIYKNIALYGNNDGFDTYWLVIFLAFMGVMTAGGIVIFLKEIGYFTVY